MRNGLTRLGVPDSMLERGVHDRSSQWPTGGLVRKPCFSVRPAYRPWTRLPI